MTLLSVPPCLVLRGGAGSLGQQVGKTKEKAGTEPLVDESEGGTEKIVAIKKNADVC